MKDDARTVEHAYLRLHSQAALKRLELPYVYHTGRDELYEIDEKAEAFLSRCDGRLRMDERGADEGFVDYCVAEGILEILPGPDPISVSIDISAVPSLRYLELQLTHRCNLACRHCYLGSARLDELALADALAIVREFASNGGLRLLISGGEPLLYPYLKEFIAGTAGLKIRRVLLTNGTLVDEDTIPWLRVENIQFSLDGWREGHEQLRGKGSFERTLKGIQAARQAGIPVSIATMVHWGNLKDFERLQAFAGEIGATEWGIDVPCVAGVLTSNQDLIVPYQDAVPFMRYAYGGGYHGSSAGFACGRHLMTVLPNGKAVKCGFYEENPLGDAREGLMACWGRLRHIPLEELECRNCPVLHECAGGCRYRAPNPLAPDPVMCAFYGVGRDQEGI